MQLRSGANFAPYDLKHSFRIRIPPYNPISTLVSVEPLIQDAVEREDLRFEEGADDSEGLGVTSRPLTPLTEIESEDEAESLHPQATTSSTQSNAKKHRNAGEKKCRAKKRVRLASSGHRPHVYAASPSTVSRHMEEMKPLRVSSDAKDFPASGEGSWVEKRKDGAKKDPWTVAELVENNFKFVEWDGQ